MVAWLVVEWGSLPRVFSDALREVYGRSGEEVVVRYEPRAAPWEPATVAIRSHGGQLEAVVHAVGGWSPAWLYLGLVDNADDEVEVRPLPLHHICCGVEWEGAAFVEKVGDWLRRVAVLYALGLEGEERRLVSALVDAVKTAYMYAEIDAMESLVLPQGYCGEEAV